MKLSPHQQLELLAKTPAGKWLVTEEGEFEKVGLLRTILEQVKGWLGYGDRTSPVAVEYAFIRLLEKSCEEDIFTFKDIQLIEKGARNAGLIKGKEVDPKKHAELALEINLIRQHVLNQAPLDITSLQNSTFEYYTLHARQLMHILPLPDRPPAKITKATQVILPPIQETSRKEPDEPSEVTSAAAPLPPAISDKKITVISPRPHNPSVDLWLNALRNKAINWNAGGRLPLDNCYRRLCRQARPQSKNADFLDACVEQLLLTAEGFTTREYKKKSLLLDRLEEHLGFNNALAVLAAGYQLAHHLNQVGNLVEREESANALALFRDKLVELTEKFPEAYAKANLTLRFNKKTVPRTFIQELIKTAAAEQKRSLITKVALGTFAALALAGVAYYKYSSPSAVVPTIPTLDFNATVYGPVNASSSILTLPKNAPEPQPQTPWQNLFESDLYGMSYPNTSTISTSPPVNIPKVPEVDAKITLPPGWKKPFSNVSDWFGAPHSNATSTLSTSPPANTIPDEAEKTLQPGRQNPFPDPFVEDIGKPDSNATDKLSTPPSAEVQKESLQNPEANTSTRFDKKLPINWLNKDPLSTTPTNVTPTTTIPNPSHTLPDEKISLINTLALSLIGMVGGMVGAVSYYLFPKTSHTHHPAGRVLPESQEPSPVSAARAPISSPIKSPPALTDAPPSSNAVSRPSTANLGEQQSAQEHAFSQIIVSIPSPGESIATPIDASQSRNAVSPPTANLRDQQQVREEAIVMIREVLPLVLVTVAAMSSSRANSSTTTPAAQQTQPSSSTTTTSLQQPMTSSAPTPAAEVPGDDSVATSLQQAATNSSPTPAAQEPGDDSVVTSLQQTATSAAPTPAAEVPGDDSVATSLQRPTTSTTTTPAAQEPGDDSVATSLQQTATSAAPTPAAQEPEDNSFNNSNEAPENQHEQNVMTGSRLGANETQKLSSSLTGSIIKILSPLEVISQDLEKIANPLLDQKAVMDFCIQIKNEFGEQFFSTADIRNQQLDMIAIKLSKIQSMKRASQPQQTTSRAVVASGTSSVQEEESPNADIVKLISHLIPLALYPPLIKNEGLQNKDDNKVALNPISIDTLMNCLDQLAEKPDSVIKKLDPRFFYKQTTAAQKIYMLSHLNFTDVEVLNRIRSDGLYKMLWELPPPSLSIFLRNARIHVPQTYRQTCTATTHNLFIQRHCGTIAEMLELAKTTIRTISEKLDKNKGNWKDDPAFKVKSGIPITKEAFVNAVLKEATTNLTTIYETTKMFLDRNSDLDPFQIAKLTREWNFTMQYIETVLDPQNPKIYSFQYMPNYYHISAAIAEIISKIGQYIPGNPADEERWVALSQFDLQELIKKFFGNLNQNYVYRHAGTNTLAPMKDKKITANDIWNRIYVENGGFLDHLENFKGHMMFDVAEINAQSEKVVDHYDQIKTIVTRFSLEGFNQFLDDMYEKEHETNSLHTYQRAQENN